MVQQFYFQPTVVNLTSHESHHEALHCTAICQGVYQAQGVNSEDYPHPTPEGWVVVIT